jgi:hypothetical protein
LQQFRECVVGDEGYRFIIHDRDSIYFSGTGPFTSNIGLRSIENSVSFSASECVL